MDEKKLKNLCKKKTKNINMKKTIIDRNNFHISSPKPKIKEKLKKLRNGTAIQVNRIKNS
jgi:hypothetical protein